MGTPIRRRVIDALVARLEQITVENGYATDAGRRVYVGEEPSLGADDPVNAIVLVIGDTAVSMQNAAGLVLEAMPFEVQAMTRVAGVESPYLDSETLLADCQRAIEEDLTLGRLLKGKMALGSTRTVPREPGMTTVGIGISYSATWLRTMGAAV